VAHMIELFHTTGNDIILMQIFELMRDVKEIHYLKKYHSPLITHLMIHMHTLGHTLSHPMNDTLVSHYTHTHTQSHTFNSDCTYETGQKLAGGLRSSMKYQTDRRSAPAAVQET
jgi:hypothetical protein